LNTTSAINLAVTQSRYLASLFDAKPELCKTIKKSILSPVHTDDILKYAKDFSLSDTNSLNTNLRLMRHHFFALSLIRDLNGLSEITETFNTHTILAETALREAEKFHWEALTKQHGLPVNSNGDIQKLIIVAMGKMGGYELNPSSDIDLVFFYEEDGATTGKSSISNQDFFTKLGKLIISSLNDYTDEGIVFRVDMRLRPFGSQGLLVSPLESFENYLITHGLDWERYAWLKSRVVLGPSLIIDALIEPFVYRKYLDFNIFESLRNIKKKISQDMLKKINDGDIKVGRGGIRTLEFIVQSFQLVWGGKDKPLRCRGFIEALTQLKNKKLIPNMTYKSLHEAYIFFRNLEHRLQYIDDAQTHKIPVSPEDKSLLASAMGLKSWTLLEHKIHKHQDKVELIFDEMFSNNSQPLSPIQENLKALWSLDVTIDVAVNCLNDLGYKKSQDTFNFIQNIKLMGNYPTLPATTKEKLNTLIPVVLYEVASVDNPDKTLVHMLNALDSIAHRSSYLSLLNENIPALKLLIKIASFDQEFIQNIVTFPATIDDLMNSSEFTKPFDLTEASKKLLDQLSRSHGDTELQMNLLRDFKNSMIFKLAIQELMHIYPIERISDALADIADFITQQALYCIWETLYPTLTFPSIGIIAYGKFGGKEMSYLSDLDLVFVFDEKKSKDRDKYIKLVQRFNSWVTSYTASGILYDIDLRLRPDGGSGLLVSSWDAYSEYQLNRSLIWEHQALTRARFVSENKTLKRKFNNLRQSIMQEQRDIGKLKTDIIEMRERIYRDKKPSGDLFDLKLSRGGLIDIEFITQFYVLGYSYKYADLCENLGNITLITKLSELSLLSSKDATSLISAYKIYRTKQHQQGLNPKNPGKVELSSVELNQKAVQAIWQEFTKK
jgi:glutamate-ammonia-ligase adenylyltransferase